MRIHYQSSGEWQRFEIASVWDGRGNGLGTHDSILEGSAKDED